jgi:hypothetical protein
MLASMRSQNCNARGNVICNNSSMGGVEWSEEVARWDESSRLKDESGAVGCAGYAADGRNKSMTDDDLGANGPGTCATYLERRIAAL